MVTKRDRGTSVVQALNASRIHLPQPTSISIASSSASHTVTAQFDAGSQTDSAGTRVSAAYHWWLSGSSLGLTLVGAEVSGASAGSNGIVFPTSTSNFNSGLAVTNSTGQLNIVLTTTGTSTYWIGFVLPNGRIALSTSFTRSCG